MFKKSHIFLYWLCYLYNTEVIISLTDSVFVTWSVHTLFLKCY